MTVLLASSEVHPFSKSGGLADMVGAMAKALADQGCRIAIVTPLYSGIREQFSEIQPMGWTLDLPLGSRSVSAEVFSMSWNKGVTVYFVDQPGFYQRPGLYQEEGRDYTDNAERFIYFSKWVAYLARYLSEPPQVVHVHDWQVGLVPLFILDQSRRLGWEQPPGTCFTIHNLAYQGIFPAASYALTNLPWDYFHPEGVEYYRAVNCLKAGLEYSDWLNTVSPRYAREITTEQYGCGLDGVLRRRQDRLSGILNGVDYQEWNTEKNPYLQHSYSIDNLDGKLAEKQDLQQALGLPVGKSTPLFGSITRLVDQKGIDIELGALEEMLHANMQFVLLGSGDHQYERAFRSLARRYPDKVAVKIGYDHGLAHQIEAACDFFLMPSRYEPCGLNQMYSLRYGTVPIVRATGGLDDTVIDLTEDLEQADGIKFYEYSARSLAKAIRKALVLYGTPDLLARFRRNGIGMDFSWDRTTEDYLKVYHRIGKWT